MSDIPPPPPPGGTPPPPPSFGAPPPGYVPFGETGFDGPTGQSKKAVWALVLGILGIVCCGPLAIVAIVLGKQAQNEVAASNGRQTGEGMAKAGFILGIVGVALWAVFLLIQFSNS